MDINLNNYLYNSVYNTARLLQLNIQDFKTRFNNSIGFNIVYKEIINTTTVHQIIKAYKKQFEDYLDIFNKNYQYLIDSNIDNTQSKYLKDSYILILKTLQNKEKTKVDFTKIRNKAEYTEEQYIIIKSNIKNWDWFIKKIDNILYIFTIRGINCMKIIIEDILNLLDQIIKANEENYLIFKKLYTENNSKYGLTDGQIEELDNKINEWDSIFENLEDVPF